MSNWSRVYLIRKIAGSLNNLQYKVCTKERVSRLARTCLYLAGGCEFERSSDTWKWPTMAPAGLRGLIEMVLKKYYFQQQLQACRAEREERAGIMERDKEGK